MLRVSYLFRQRSFLRPCAAGITGIRDHTRRSCRLPSSSRRHGKIPPDIQEFEWQYNPSRWLIYLNISPAKLSISRFLFRNLPTWIPHMQAPRMDGHYKGCQTSPKVWSNTLNFKKMQTYIFSASTAFLATSSPWQSVSTLASCTSSSTPRLPICGFAVSPGRNWPVPTEVQQHSV